MYNIWLLKADAILVSLYAQVGHSLLQCHRMMSQKEADQLNESK